VQFLLLFALRLFLLLLTRNKLRPAVRDALFVVPAALFSIVGPRITPPPAPFHALLVLFLAVMPPGTAQCERGAYSFRVF